MVIAGGVTAAGGGHSRGSNSSALTEQETMTMDQGLPQQVGLKEHRRHGPMTTMTTNTQRRPKTWTNHHHSNKQSDNTNNLEQGPAQQLTLKEHQRHAARATTSTNTHRTPKTAQQQMVTVEQMSDTNTARQHKTTTDDTDTTFFSSLGHSSLAHFAHTYVQ